LPADQYVQGLDHMGKPDRAELLVDYLGVARRAKLPRL
jgi:hypothetical protein